MFKKKNLAHLAVSGLITLGVYGQASADTFRFALGFPSGAPIEAGKAYADAVKKYTDGKHRVRIFELSLLDHSEMNDGVGQGLADIGYLLTAYTPSEYPHSNMGADLSMVMALDDTTTNQEGFAYSGAMLEYIMMNCEECQAEFTKNNIVYTGVVSTPSYVMFCNDPVTTLNDIKGKRIRISGAPWARWTRAFDATPVVLPIGDAYEALSQGVIDCTFFSPTELTNFNLIEVVKNIIPNVPGGLYAAGGASSLNKTKWDAMSTEEKTAFLKAGAVMSAEITYRYQEQALADLAKAQEQGIKIIEAEPEVVAKSHAFIEEDLNFIPKFYHNEYNLNEERLTELSQTMLDLIEKWKGIIANADIQNANDLRDIYWQEVYSKIDPNTYSPKQ